VDRTRLFAPSSPHSGDWLYASLITSVSLRLSDEATRTAVAHRLGCKVCEPHTCVFCKAVHTRELHGLSCRKSASRQQCHSHINDIIWRAIKQAQIPALKEPVSLMLENNKRPDGTTLLPWARGKPLPWDVTVPNTFAESHISDAVSTPGAAANKATQHKLDKYAKLLDTRLLPSRRWDSRHMEQHGHWTGATDWQTYHHRHTGR